MREKPCPHCGQDLRLPEEANLESWNAKDAEIARLRAEPLRQQCDRLMSEVALQEEEIKSLLEREERIYAVNVDLSSQVARLEALVVVGREMESELRAHVSISKTVRELQAKWRSLEGER